jgi:hypothetical protein
MVVVEAPRPMRKPINKKQQRRKAMSKFVEGILFPTGEDAEPTPVAVGDLESIQGFVGGWIDAVTQTYDPNDLYGDEVPDGAQPFTLVGYVNDEGIILGLERNDLASVVFRRELYGPVVIVSGTSPSGEYDGDNYNVPTWFADAVCNGSLAEATSVVKKLAVISRALAVCVGDGLIEMEEVKLAWLLANLGHEESKLLITTLVAYGRAKLDSEVSEETEWSVTDEEIEKFLQENGGK